MSNLNIIFAKLLRRHGRFYFLMTAGCFFLVFWMLYFLPVPQYQISGLIRIGQVPVLNGEQLVQTGLLMSVDVSMALLRQGAVGAPVENAVTDQDWHLRVRPAADNLLELKILAPSIRRAREVYIGLVRHLKSVHDDIYSTGNEFWTGQNVRVSNEISAGQKALDAPAGVCREIVDAISDNPLLCANLLANEAARIDRMRSYQVQIQEALLPIRTFPTDSLGDLNFSNAPVSPNWLTSAALSLFVALGFFFIILMAGGVGALLGWGAKGG